MKEKTTSRRDFLKASVVTSCLGCGFVSLMHGQAQEDPCHEQLKKNRYQMSVWYEKDKIKTIQPLQEKYGQELVSVLKENTIKRTTETFKKRNIERRDLTAVKNILWNSLEQGFEFEVVHDTPQHLEYKVTRCYLAELANELNAPEVGFALHCAWDYGFCRGLNPDIQFTRTKTLMKGDDCCNHYYKLG